LEILDSLKISRIRLLAGVVAHSCNPIHPKDRDLEEQGLRPAQLKLSRPHIINMPGLEAHAYDPSYVGGGRLEDPGLSLAPGMTQLKEQLPTKCVI
jgi:hypothetical protein